MRPQETRRIVLGTSLAAVAAACVPGLPERRPEDSWPTSSIANIPVSFRYPPEWERGEDYVAFRTPLGKNPNVSALVVFTTMRVDDVGKNTFEEVKNTIATLRRDEVIEDITFRKWKGILLTDRSDPIKREVFFVGEGNVYRIIFYCQVNERLSPAGERGMSVDSYLRNHPEDMWEVMRLRDRVLPLFTRILNTVEVEARR